MKTFLLLFACFVSLHASGLETEDVSLTPLMCDPVAIPDPNFEQVLLDQNKDTDGVLNGQICRSDAESITTLSLRNKNISDLTGIEAFINLTTLRCGQNNLTSLNLQQNVFLIDLSCDINKLTSLDVSNNLVLRNLGLSGNPITNLNVNNNLELEQLTCKITGLTSLDVRNNIKLKQLSVGSLGSAGLSTLDLSNNDLLESLEVAGAIMQELDLTNNLNLETLDINFTNIESLDLKNHIKLGQMRIYSNKELYNLDVRNGTNINIGFFRTYNLPNLFCIGVDDVTFANSQEASGAWSKDNQATYSIDCQSLYPGPAINLSCITYAFGPSAFLAMSWEFNGSPNIDNYEV